MTMGLLSRKASFELVVEGKCLKETLESVLVNLSLRRCRKKSIDLKGPESKYEVTASS